MPLSVGDKLGPYEILAPIGKGGMGEVYRAHDPRLGRDVAIKVPAQQFTERFEREAKAIAALNHPNICTLHDIGPDYLVMEFIEGTPLHGPLPLDQALRYAMQICDALDAAHKKSITHRDLKPGNILVTASGVKLLDFGLAKITLGKIGTEGAPPPPDAATQTIGLTEAGTILGTAAYMSPEQAKGEEVDARSDIFSFGLVLYEMLSGRRAFSRNSTIETMAAILRDEPAPLDAPSNLSAIVTRCLRKSPASRFQTMNEVRAAFEQATADSAAARAEEGFWVAVLPFRYSGANAELTALAECLTEDVVAGLSRFSYLRVVSLSVTSRYAHGALDVHSAGKELGAHYVMEGSLRQAGTSLRIVAQLVDATSGAHLWAETYERPFLPEAVFEIQDYVVPRIVSTVADTRGVLPRSMSEALRNKDLDQMSPYEAVLRSFAHFQRVTAEEHAPARAGLERAVQLAPDNADCWAMLSLVVKEEYTHGFNLRPDPLGRAFAAAQRAVEAAPSNHLAYHALASVLYFRREFQAFRSAAERAIALNPMDGFTIAYLGFLTAYAGEWERGCALVERARSLNPHHPGWYWFAPFFDAYRKCDYRGAVQIGLKINMPGFWRTNLALAAAYGQLGEMEPARNALRALVALRPDFALVAREELAKWWDPELVEHLIDGLRKAGLEIAGERVAETGS